MSVASERQLRVKAQELVGDHLVTERAPFSVSLKEGGEEIRSAPYVYVLWDKVDQHER